MKTSEFKVGQQVKSLGYDMKGRTTVEAVRIVEIFDVPEEAGISPVTGKMAIFDCVVLADGIKVKANSADFVG